MRDLTVEFTTRRGIVSAVQQVDIAVAKGETLGIVGESGSGKSVTSYAVMRILDRAGRIAEGSVSFSGVDVRAADEDQMRDLRGREISMIFQNPRAALNPIRKVGRQIEDVLRQHAQAGSEDITEKAIGILERVRIAGQGTLPCLSLRAVGRHVPAGGDRAGARLPAAAADRRRADHRPRRHHAEDGDGPGGRADARAGHVDHSHHPRPGAGGGLLRPRGGDGEGQCGGERGVQDHLHRALPPLHAQADAGDAAPGRRLARPAAGGGRGAPRGSRRRQRRMAPQPHRAATIARHCWWSRASSRSIRARTSAAPSPSSSAQRRAGPETPMFRAVDGISFTVHRGESLGLVGESGCGKSTTSTMVMRLIDKSDGRIVFDGQDIGAIPGQEVRQAAAAQTHPDGVPGPDRQAQSALHRRAAIADPILRLGEVGGRKAVRARCEELARQVGLPVELLGRFPHQLSGGQKARVGIARAIALNPDLVILDEPTAALDVSVQALVLNLLQQLKETLGMSYLFVSHDLNVVRLLCDRVMVMQAGRIVEEGPTARVLFAPEAQYTRDLLAAIPRPPV